MPITYSTGGRVSLGRTTIALSNIESQSESQGPNLYTTTFNFSFLENNPDYILIDRNGVQINSITTEPSAPGSFANYFIYVARTNGDDMESTDEVAVVMPSHPIQRAITYTGGNYNSRTVRLQIPFTQAAANKTYNNQIGIYAPEPATPTYSGSVAFNFNFTEPSDYWGHPLDVMESIYIVGTNVDTGLQHVLYEHLEEDVYPIHPYYGSYPMVFGESANSLIVHRYEDKEANSPAPSDLGNLLTITFKLKQGVVFTYNDDEDRGWSDINDVRMNGELVRVNESDPVWGSEYGGTSTDNFTWKRIESGVNQQTWAVTLNKYPWANGDWVYMLRDRFIGHLEVVGTSLHEAPSGLTIINATDNQLYDVGPAGGYGQMLSNYSFDAQMQFPLSLDAFNIPTEDYSDIYAAGINYYDIGRIDMELESPVTVMYILYDEHGSDHVIYESAPISSTGFVQIGLEDLSQKISEEMAYNSYTITKAELYIYSHTEHYSLSN